MTCRARAESSRRLVAASSTSAAGSCLHKLLHQPRRPLRGTEGGSCCETKARAANPNVLLGAGAAQPTNKHTGKAHAELSKIPAPCAMGSETRPTSTLLLWELQEHLGTQKQKLPRIHPVTRSLTTRSAVVTAQELPRCSKATNLHLHHHGRQEQALSHPPCTSRGLCYLLLTSTLTKPHDSN